MIDAAKLKYMAAPRYRGREIIGTDPLPYTFANLQQQVERALKNGLSEQEIFAIEWVLIESRFERLRILNYTIALASERLRKEAR
jgi:hypothetical protein